MPIRLSDDVRKRIEELAARNEHLTSTFVDEVLREALGFEEEAAQASVERGLADVAAGRLSTEELRLRIEKKLGT